MTDAARTIRRQRSLFAASALGCALLFGCKDDEPSPATQIIVTVTSDMTAETELSRIEIAISDRDGGRPVAAQDFVIVAEAPKDEERALPLHFSVTKGKASSFLLVVTGYGPVGPDGGEEPVVQQKFIASFSDGKTLLLRVFLGRVCLNNFCAGDEDLVCYVADRGETRAGQCGAVVLLGFDDLEVVDPDDLPSLLAPPSGVQLDGGLDAGGDAGRDAGCGGGDCPCVDAEDCQDALFCTIDACDATTNRCTHEARVCDADDNACTLAPVCNEKTNACEEAFDGSSLSSDEHCGSSATSACAVCEGDATRASSCVGGTCVLACLSGRFDADGSAANGCECVQASTTDDADDAAVDANCDGADGEVSGTRFVYATPAGAGTHDGASPVNAATLPEAFAIAASTARDEILAASGTYTLDAPLVAPDELVLFGGYAADFRSRAGTSEVTTALPSALLVNNVTAVVIDSVNFASGDQAAPGAHTHTIDVIKSALQLRRLVVTAGNGGPGAAGTAGPKGANATQVGAGGGDAPTKTTGGPGGSGGVGGNGGKGGDYSGGVASGGVNGSNASVTGVGCGHGGASGAGSSLLCQVGFFYGGNPGSPGEPGCVGGAGAKGNAATGPGSIVAGAWTPAAATMGGPGGSGGAGGGGGGGGAAECGSLGAAGGGGGEGGAGGDGGTGGTPGGSGGASIAILSDGGEIAVDQVELKPGNGGVGGKGGSGGAGGGGAPGGASGKASSDSTGVFPNATGISGGNGGVGRLGGSGGGGGCGGGGAGGASVGIFGSTGGLGTTTVAGTPAYTLGSGGAAGAACDIGVGDPGSAGSALDTYGF